jgi:hypothetical protein
MVIQALHRAGIRSWMMHATSFGAIGLCIGLWIQAKTHDQEQRGNAERRALFVGLWPPMFWLIGDSLRRETEPTRLSRRLRATARTAVRAGSRRPGG